MIRSVLVLKPDSAGEHNNFYKINNLALKEPHFYRLPSCHEIRMVSFLVFLLELHNRGKSPEHQ